MNGRNVTTMNVVLPTFKINFIAPKINRQSLMRYIFFVSLCLFFIPSYSSAQMDGDTLETRADSLYDHFREEEALSAYQKILKRDSTRFQALWRTSFLYSRIGNRFENKDKKKEYFNRAISLAEKALRIDSSHTRSNFVMAVAMGRKALVASPRERVEASRAIKHYVDKAINIDSTNAGAWHVLGRWHFEAANLGFFERLAANTLFGGVPGDPSNEKAIEAFRRATELKPKYVLYHHDLAMAYEEVGMVEKAIQACESALNRQSLTPDDSRLKNDCKRWIKEWKQ